MISLPTLSSLDQSSPMRIWLAVEPADMRCGFDRLAARALAVTGQDPLCGHLFLFRSPGSVELRGSELAMILDGIDLSSLKRSKRYQKNPAEGGTPSSV